MPSITKSLHYCGGLAPWAPTASRRSMPGTNSSATPRRGAQPTPSSWRARDSWSGQHYSSSRGTQSSWLMASGVILPERPGRAWPRGQAMDACGVTRTPSGALWQAIPAPSKRCASGKQIVRGRPCGVWMPSMRGRCCSTPRTVTAGHLAPTLVEPDPSQSRGDTWIRDLSRSDPVVPKRPPALARVICPTSAYSQSPRW